MQRHALGQERKTISGTLLSLMTGGISSLVGPVITRLADLIPDASAKAKALQDIQDKLMAADAAMEQQQNQINQAEASNENIFVSGWRPFIGWVCGIGLGWQIFLGPFVGYIAGLLGSKAALPVFDTGTTTALLVPMLGLGAYRTFEKVQGVAGSQASAVRQGNIDKVTAANPANRYGVAR